MNGWTSNKIGDEWFILFERATVTKANRKKHLLICDGYRSHISAKTIAFYIQHDIELLLIPPHSSHLYRPLDVGVFSLLKHAMTDEMDNVIWYGVSTIKKFEWLEAYRNACLQALIPSNIKFRFSNISLIPFNQHHIIICLSDASPEPDLSLPSSRESAKLLSYLFTNAIETPLKLDSTSLWAVDMLLLDNVKASNLNTLIKRYVSYLTSLSKNLRAWYTASKH